MLQRIDQVLEQLPKARQQARQRILSGQLVDNQEKILSLYEREIRVIVRKKAGAEVEFVNTFLLSAGALDRVSQTKSPPARLVSASRLRSPDGPWPESGEDLLGARRRRRYGRPGQMGTADARLKAKLRLQVAQGAWVAGHPAQRQRG